MIIGAGITGLTTAYFLKDTNQKITIIDKSEVGRGVTSKTTAKITYLQQDIYSKLTEMHNKEISKKYYNSQKEAINTIVKIIKDNNISCDLEKVDSKATVDADGIAYICKNFSWPDGFPSHASPYTPGIITEGGELGYALANAYGLSLGHPEKTTAVLIGDGELETATAIDSLNLKNLLASAKNGKVLPVLHLNGYKISAPSIYARKSERELNELIRGFGFTPVWINGEDIEGFQTSLAKNIESPFYILKTEKGYGGPNRYHEAHQIPLKNPKTDKRELHALEEWLRSYDFPELFSEQNGAMI